MIHENQEVTRTLLATNREKGFGKQEQAAMFGIQDCLTKKDKMGTGRQRMVMPSGGSVGVPVIVS